MSSASSANGLLNDLQMAEKDLAMYAAIIGCKPTVESAEAPAGEPVEAPEPIAETNHEPRRISLWMHHVSHEARKRFDEARMRLAS